MYNSNNNISIYLFKELKDLIFNPQGFLNFQARLCHIELSISSLSYTVAGAMQPKFFPRLTISVIKELL